MHAVLINYDYCVSWLNREIISEISQIIFDSLIVGLVNDLPDELELLRLAVKVTANGSDHSFRITPRRLDRQDHCGIISPSLTAEIVPVGTGGLINVHDVLGLSPLKNFLIENLLGLFDLSLLLKLRDRVQIYCLVANFISQINLAQGERRQAYIKLLAQEGYPVSEAHYFHVSKLLGLNQPSLKPFINGRPSSSSSRDNFSRQLVVVRFITANNNRNHCRAYIDNWRAACCTST